MHAQFISHADATARLLSALQAHGITYLIAPMPIGEAEAHDELTDDELLAALARSDDPRIADAAVSVLLLHPTLGRAIASDGPPGVTEGQRERLLTRALAALYLQRICSPRLALALGPQHPRLEEAIFQSLWRERGLPPPWIGDGETGLAALEAWECRRTGSWAHIALDWANQVQHVIASLSQRPRTAFAPALATASAEQPSLDTDESPDEEAWRMSMRQDVGSAEIERFLRELGSRVRHPGRIYLAGGAALVHAGLRGQGAATADIDLKLRVDDEAEVESVLRSLKDALGVNVELAWPGDFIPVPSGWEEASRYVGRYGKLDVFYMDFTTLALAKIERASARDLRDVELLAQAGEITRDSLLAAADAIRPQLGHARYFNVDPSRFDEHLAAVTRQLWGA